MSLTYREESTDEEDFELEWPEPHVLHCILHSILLIGGQTLLILISLI